MNQPKSNLFFILLLFGFGLIQAQKTESVSLINLLKSAEEEYDINFNYLNEDIDAVQFKKPKTLPKLDELIKFIQENSILQIKKVDQKTYVVNPKPYCVEIRAFQTNRPLVDFDIISDDNSGIYQKKNKLHFLLSADTFTISKKGFVKKTNCSR